MNGACGKDNLRNASGSRKTERGLSRDRLIHIAIEMDLQLPDATTTNQDNQGVSSGIGRGSFSLRRSDSRTS